jgi:hypothetical protein
MSDIYSNEWRWSTLTFGEGVSEEVAAPTAEYHPPRPQSLRSLDLGAVTAHPLVTPFGSHPRTRSTKPLLRSVSMSTDATLLDRGRESRTSSRTSLDEPLPTPAAVLEADGYEIYNEDCLPVTFGSLYPTAKTNPDGPAPRLVAFFLRVFMCGPCQDYVRLSVNRLDRKVLKEYNISVVVITMGSKEGLRGYRKAVKCPFPVFSDPTLGLYNIFGMHYGLEIGRFIAPGHKPEYNQSVLPVQMAQGFIVSSS